MATQDVAEVVTRIASRDGSRPEAQLQAEIYRLLTMGALELDTGDVARIEVPTGDGTRRRLDVQVGHCCIEVKKDLRTGQVLANAREQLAGYVQSQAQIYGPRYVGILTDGVSWHLCRLHDQALVEVTTFAASRDRPDELLVWLESVLATQQLLLPTPEEIRNRLGAQSPAHQLDHATLSDLFERGNARPEVQVKKELWAKLLRTAFGSAFTDSAHLFIDHTLLVLSAEAIAHAVMGYDLAAGDLTPQEIARGTRFHDSQIYGAVEEDFFDWVLEVEGGPEFVADLARRLGRFEWSTQMRHDILKALYTSVLPSQAREALGEYYTPDWLAEQMVQDVYTDPATQHLLEPSCGSGTFLLHAIRLHLEAVEATGVPVGEAVASLTEHVTGMDIHPVSVILARVTYLMAIGAERLRDDTRGPITVPVYLGDSVQWEQRTDLLPGANQITVSTSGDDLVAGGGVLFGDDLRFPLSVLESASNFDQLVSAMADKAVTTNRPAKDVMTPLLRQRGVHNPEDRAMLVETFDTMRRLHDSGRNHIWGYYVRNLIRPLWLSDPRNRADVLVGNPPWLRYSKMTSAMQDRYRSLARERNLLTGGLGASARDLSTLFVARSVELYLCETGRFAFVMPHGVLSRRPHTGFRSGQWSSKSVQLTVAFDSSWDLDQVTTGFPMSSCVVRGSSSPTASALPAAVSAWSGALRNPDVTWEVAQQQVTIIASTVRALDPTAEALGSPYRKAFRDGAILYPRYLLFVTETPDASPLGAGAGRVTVESFRAAQEKPPWKNQPSLSGVVERRFVRDVYLGESIAPFRALAPRRAVLPLAQEGILTPSQIEEAPGLSGWWSKVEDEWTTHRKPSEQQPLLTRFDYHSQLSAQIPSPPNRVVYSKSGNTLAAARIEDRQAIIDHKLYWAATSGPAEARYLVAILNSATLLERVAPLQARGLFGPRDFDKHVFHVPIPVFDQADPAHLRLSDLAAEAEKVAATIEPVARFQTTRRLVRDKLALTNLSAQIEDTVRAVVPPTD